MVRATRSPSISPATITKGNSSRSREGKQLLAEAKIIYRLLAAKPIFVSFNVTNRCTMRCRFCNVPNQSGRDMDLNEIDHVLGILRRMGVPVVGVTGGEPFLRQDLHQVLGLIARHGMKSTLVTNGDLINAKRMSELRPLRNIVHFAFSLDTFDLDTYASIRGSKALPRNLATFLDAIRFGPRSVYKLNIVLGPHNVDELDTFLEFAMAWRVGLTFIPLNIGPGGLHRAESFEGFDKAARKRVASAFHKLYRWKLEGKPLWDHRDYYLLSARYLLGEDLGECMAGKLFLDLRCDGKLAFCNELEPFVDLLQVDNFTLDDLRRARKEWEPKIEACRHSSACCYTCSYNVTATARNLPAYIWDYLRYRARFGNG